MLDELKIIISLGGAGLGLWLLYKFATKVLIWMQVIETNHLTHIQKGVESIGCEMKKLNTTMEKVVDKLNK